MDSEGSFSLDHVTKEDFLVHDLDKVQAAYAKFPGKMYAGRLPADNGKRQGMTMFWLFEPDEPEVPGSIVTWLNGGPGCSSFNCGVMMEHSPVTQPLRPAGFCCLKPTPELEYNEHAWTKATSMLYVEHPWGTGFSYGLPEPQTEHEASGDLYAFMQNFFKVFDHLADYQYFVFGESYAGMFVPSILRYFHHKNLALEDGSSHSRSKSSSSSSSSLSNMRKINVAGGAIGNGWMDPAIQGPATIDYSWWHGLIDKPTRDALLDIWNRCASGDKDAFVEGAPFHTFTVQDDCGMMWGILQASGHPNEYDISTFDANVDQVTFTSEAFYNQPEVKKALHAPEDHFWHGCQWGEGRRRRHLMEKHRQLYMDEDKPLSMAPYIGELLDAGIPLLVYNGDRDMTTNMVGTEMVLNYRLEWKGKDQWLDAPRGIWKTNNYPSGWAKEFGNLTFAVVYNSGHMVPYNQPEPAYDLLVRFLTRKSMIDDVLPQVRGSKPTPPLEPSWLQLYPEGKQAYVESFEHSSYPFASLNHAGSSSSIEAGLSGSGGTPLLSTATTSNPSTMGLLVAFVAGMGVALLVAQFLGRREGRRRTSGYTAVPNAVTESNA